MDVVRPDDIFRIDPQLAELVRRKSAGRGFGYWLWKPGVLKRGLEAAVLDGEGFVYLDAGCEINSAPLALERLDEYMEVVRRQGPLAMRLPGLTLAEWCKRETLDFFDISLEEARRIPMLEAGVVILDGSQNCRRLVDEWIAAAKIDEGRLFDETPGPMPEYPEFKEHRHDSAVLCCIFHRNGWPGIPSETYFAGRWLSVAPNYPFWAMRNRLPFSIAPGTPGDRLRRLWLRLKGITLPPWESSPSAEQEHP